MQSEPGVPGTHSVPGKPKAFLPTTVEGWLMTVGGLACIGYGLYSVVTSLVGKTSLSVIAMVLLALGGMIIPFRWIGIAVGVVLIGLGVFMFMTNYVTGQALIVGVLGLIAVAERWRRV